MKMENEKFRVENENGEWKKENEKCEMESGE